MTQERKQKIKEFLRVLFCIHAFTAIDQGYVGYVIVKCVKCGWRKSVQI